MSDGGSEFLDQKDIDALISSIQSGEVIPEVEDSPAPKASTLPSEKFELGDLAGAPHEADHSGIDMLKDVMLKVKIELGRTTMFVSDILKLRQGSVVELNKLAGDPVDIYVNGRLVARGEVLILNDNFAVRIQSIINPQDPSRMPE